VAIFLTKAIKNVHSLNKHFLNNVEERGQSLRFSGLVQEDTAYFWSTRWVTKKKNWKKRKYFLYVNTFYLLKRYSARKVL
jgi:hypothetical protein